MIRELTKDDRKTFIQLWKPCQKEIADRNPLASADIDALAYFSDVFHAYTMSYLIGGCWVYELDGEPIAITMAGESPNPFPWPNPTGKMAQMWGLYTQPEHRGNGYSTELGVYSIQTMKTMGFDAYVTEVAFSNADAIHIMDSTAPAHGCTPSLVRYIAYLKEPNVA